MAFWFLPVFYRWFLAPLFVLLSVFLPHKANRVTQLFYIFHTKKDIITNTQAQILFEIPISHHDRGG